MNKIIILILLAVIVQVGVFRLNAQKLYLWKTNGNPENFTISEVKKLTFSNGSLVVTTRAEGSGSYTLSELAKVTFDGATSVSYLKDTETSPMYYNSSDEAVYFRTSQIKSARVSVYKANGMQVKSASLLQGSQSIDVSDLASGLYLLKVNNQVLKFVKQ